MRAGVEFVSVGNATTLPSSGMPSSVISATPRPARHVRLDTCVYVIVGFPTVEQETQISALVSRTTKELLERHVRSTGVKKGHLVEQALRHHLVALEQLPADVIVHPKLVVTRRSGEAILKQIATGKPAKALRALLRDGD